MGILNTLESLLGGRGDQPSPSAYSPFRCGECGHEFESTLAEPRDIECPECGGTRIEHA